MGTALTQAFEARLESIQIVGKGEDRAAELLTRAIEKLAQSRAVVEPAG